MEKLHGSDKKQTLSKEMIDLSNVFDGLDAREIDYVKMRANAKSNFEALKLAKLSQGWLRVRDKDELFKRAMAIKGNSVMQAQSLLEESLLEAVKVKTAGLKARDERIKQSVSTEIIDRVMGKPSQHMDVTTNGESLPGITITGVDYRTAITNLAPRSMGDSDSSGESESAFDGSEMG